VVLTGNTIVLGGTRYSSDRHSVRATFRQWRGLCQRGRVRESMLAMVRPSFIPYLMFAAILEGQRPPYWNQGAKIPIYGIGISAPTSVVVDNPEIRKLISEEETRQDLADRFYREKHKEDEKLQHADDLIKHPDRVLLGHKEFVQAMAQVPAITVVRNARGRVLQISKARCLPDGTSTVTFIRMVVIGKKAPAGTEVWVCENPYAFGTP
jgi:hypothetical protein